MYVLSLQFYFEKFKNLKFLSAHAEGVGRKYA